MRTMLGRMLVGCETRVLTLWRRRQATMRWRWWTLRLLLVLAHWLLARRARLPRWTLLLLLHPVGLIEWIVRLRLHLRILQFGRAAAIPVVASGKWWWCGPRWWVLCVCAPLRAWRTSQRVWLVCLRVHILRQWHASLVR